jgi:EPS-associated MarR family transcriptional regulator
MIEQFPNEDLLSIIREIKTDPALSQRLLSEKLGISLGKTNYLLKELIAKGLIKVRRFTNRPDKVKKINYVLTSKGFRHMVSLTWLYLKRKEEEYNLLKKDWERLGAGVSAGQELFSDYCLENRKKK